MAGSVHELWRYPIKSMAGEARGALFLGFSGVYGDRLFAFTRADGPAVFPYMTGRQKAEMVLYRPRFREERALPGNAEAVLSLAAGPTPIYADDALVDVTTPMGAVLAVDDPELAAQLNDKSALTLLRSDRTMADCRPVSLISRQSVQKLGVELDCAMDLRRFRANLVLDLPGSDGFGEDALVGKTVRVGERVRLMVLERDQRCAMIGIDPDSAERDRDIPAHVAKAHDGKIGIYAAVLAEGIVRPGDAIIVES